MRPSSFLLSLSSYFFSYLLPASLHTTSLKSIFFLLHITIPMSLKCCVFVWGCRGNGLIFHGTLYLMAVNSLNGAYQHNQINYLLRHWQCYHLREEYTKCENGNYLFVSARQVSSTSSTKSEGLFQRVRNECTSSSWEGPLPRKWWRRGGCQQWPQRSSPYGPCVSLAPQRPVCEWLLLGEKKKKRIHRDQIKKMQLIRQNPNQIWRPFARGTWTKKQSAQPHTSSALVIDVTLWRLINQWTDSVAFIYISTHSLALSCVYFEGSSLLIVHLLAVTSAHCGSSCTGRDKCVLFLPLVNHVWGKWMLLL